MVNKNDGKQFEILTKEIFEALVENPTYTKVEHNVKLPGKDGPRQIDVLLRAQVGSLKILTIIECKDKNKNLDVQYVDALHSKMQDVNAHNAVLVARKGFSKTALQKAKRVGITLCTAMETRSVLWDIGAQVPVVVTHVKPNKLEPHFRCSLEAGTQIDFKSVVMINDIYMPEYFRDSLIAGEIQFDETEKSQIWYPQNLGSSPYIRDVKGNRIDIKQLEIHFQMKFAYYFGYLHDLESTRALLNKTENTMHLMYKTEELFDYCINFSCFGDKGTLPKIDGVNIVGVAFPEVKFDPIDMMSIIHEETGDRWQVKAGKTVNN
jgi:Restriction endonuclease